MKTTKKLLMILSAVALLAATVFSVVSGAVKAGDGTTMDEYLNMKKVKSEDFEDNASSIFSGVANLDKAPGQYSTLIGKIHTISNNRKGVASVYDPEGTVSTKFYVIDYSYNTNATAAHLYVQPKLGDLNKVDTTPANGFVSEWDMAFFSPLEIVMTEKTEQATDPETGELLWELDENGKQKLDENGDPIPKLVYVMKNVYDENGNLVYETDAEGNTVYQTDEEGNVIKDDNGDPIPVIKQEHVMTPVLEPVLDDNGDPILDANGNVIMGEKSVKLPFVGLGTSKFEVGMYNTVTYKDGRTELLTFETTAATDTTPGSIKINIVGENLLSNAPVFTFAPDEWIHITVQYDASNLLTSVYVGRDGDEGRTLIATVSALDPEVENKGNTEQPVYPLQFRIGATARSGAVGLDNFISYQGTTIHDPDLIEKLDADEVLVMFAGILDNADTDPINRHQAFLDIGEYSIENYYANGSYINTNSVQVKNAVDTYLSYKNNVDGKLDELVAAVCEANAEKFVGFVNNAVDIERKLNNIATRTVRISMASDFLTSVGTYIDRSGDTFKTANETLKNLEKQVEADTAANEFITYMNLFRNAVDYGASVSRITVHYNGAKALRSSIADYTELQATDSSGAANLKTAVDYYDGNDSLNIKSAQTFINEATLELNSVRFINIINILRGTTEADWKNDNGSIRNLWYVAFNILRNEGVDESIEGYETAKLIFDQIHAYYWEKTQSEHVQLLSAKLATYNVAGSSYIDKAGICTYVENYIDKNYADIDFDNAEIARLVKKNQTYIVQLETLVGDYKNLLTQNTAKFINAMKIAAVLNTYADLKPIYEEATEYYYSMDIIGDDIESYVERYESLRTMILATEADCSVFVAIVNGSFVNDGETVYKPLSEITDKTELYKSLNACYSYTENLDYTYEGVEVAKKLYDAKYADYMGTATVVNEQLEETVNTACAARGNWDIDRIVAFVKNLFK